MPSSPLKQSYFNSIWLVTELCYKNHSWRIFPSLCKDCSDRESPCHLEVREQKRFLSEADDDASLYNQLNSTNIPDFCVWTFSVLTIQDHKIAKKKKKDKKMPCDRIHQHRLEGEIMKGNISKTQQRKVSRHFRRQKYVQSTPILLCQIHLTCADKANIHLPLL